MKLTDDQIGVFVDKHLKLPPGKRQEYLDQVDYLIGRMQAKIDEESRFAAKKFTKTGSLRKGTVLKPRGENGVDDIAVDLDVSEADRDDLSLLHQKILELLIAVYLQKDSSDFQVQPRTLGIHFRDSGLDVDLVPLIPIDYEPGFAWQPSSQGGRSIKTNVQGQLAFIRSRAKTDPQFRTVVRLMKKWRNEQELDHLRSFTIELILAHRLDQSGPPPSLEDGVLRAFLYMAQSRMREPLWFPENGTVATFPDDPVVILDPVNSSNNVTQRLSAAERDEIVARSEAAFETITTARRHSNKTDTVEYWREVFGRSFVIEE